MWIVAVNPVAGGGRAQSIAARTITFLQDRQIPFQVVSARNQEEFSQQLAHALNEIGSQRKCPGVICVGGDGLAHIVLQLVVPLAIAFAIVPAGTGNDIVRTLGWSLDSIDSLLDRIINTPPQPIDLGNVDSEWFAGVLSTGFDSVVNERANMLRWPKGPQRYNLAIALELPKFSPIRYEITTDARTFTADAMLIAIGNGRSYGGGMYVCPQAKLHDGLFDIMILHEVSKLEFLKVFPRVYSGTHISHPAVEIFRTSKVSIDAKAIAYADGERIGPAPIVAQCIQGAGLTWLL